MRTDRTVIPMRNSEPMRPTEPMRRPSPLESMRYHLQRSIAYSSLASLGILVYLALNHPRDGISTTVVVISWLLLIVVNHDRLHAAGTLASFPLIAFWLYHSDAFTWLEVGILVANVAVRFIETVPVAHLRREDRAGRLSDNPDVTHHHGVLYTPAGVNAGLLVLLIGHDKASRLPALLASLDIPTPVLAFSATLLVSGIIFLIVINWRDE